MDNGSVLEMKEGDLFHGPPGHDSWIVGDEPYVSLHFLGAAEYTASEGKQSQTSLLSSIFTRVAMAHKEHRYSHELIWTGNCGTGTSDYRAYERAHTIEIAGKPRIMGSSDPAFRGDQSRHNPEDLFVASISACHMLWYLGLCAASRVTVLDYRDSAEGVMVEGPDGAGRFTRVMLRPRVKLAPNADLALAERLHHDAHEKCFIANSVNFQIDVEAKVAATDYAGGDAS